MQINTLECGARQIVLDPSDNYEILFRNQDENEVMLAFNGGESHVMAPPLPGKLTPLHPDHFFYQGA